MEKNRQITWIDICKWMFQTLLFYLGGWIIYAIPWWINLVAVIQTGNRMITGNYFDLIYNVIAMSLYGFLLCFIFNRKTLQFEIKNFSKKIEEFYTKAFIHLLTSLAIFYSCTTYEPYYIVSNLYYKFIVPLIPLNGKSPFSIEGYLVAPDAWACIWISLGGLIYMLMKFLFDKRIDRQSTIVGSLG